MGDTCSSCTLRNKTAASSSTYHHNNGYGGLHRLQSPPSPSPRTPPPPITPATSSSSFMPLRICPRRGTTRLSCIFLVLVPMLGALSMAGLWTFYCKQAWDRVEHRNAFYQSQVLQLGQLVLDFNMERELTIMYTTARNFESQVAAKEALDYGRKVTDDSLQRLYSWPGTATDGQLFRSPHLFVAVLDNHRTNVKIGNYFWDELQFYTNIIDVIFGWLNRETGLFGESEVWQWLLAYSYLMGSVNYLGAEQALCSAFYSVICFSHRETFYYANFSFSGEAVFRLYRQAYPGYREGIWRVTPHEHFFPELSSCREEIFADMDYHGMSMDPSLCDFARKNETRFHDLDLLTVDENDKVLVTINALLQQDSDRSMFELILSVLIVASVLFYIVISHICRCVCIKCRQARKERKWRDRKEAELMIVSEHEDNHKMLHDLHLHDHHLHDMHHDNHIHDTQQYDQMALQQTSTMIKYDDFNCKGPKSIHVKVATV